MLKKPKPKGMSVELYVSINSTFLIKYKEEFSRNVILGNGDYNRGLFNLERSPTYDFPPSPIKYNAIVVFIFHL